MSSRSFLENLFRAEIRALTPYKARGGARSDIIQLDANENPWLPAGGQASSRTYPDQQPSALTSRLAALYGVPEETCLVTRGADEAIDLLIRATCRANIDAIAISPPTFGVYQVAATLQGAKTIEVPLSDSFQLDEEVLIQRILSEKPKLCFICRPNNPSGTMYSEHQVLSIAKSCPDTLIVVDEAYIEFSDANSIAPAIQKVQNLAVLRTLSKAYALAGARIGCLIAQSDLIEIARRVVAPYPLSAPAMDETLRVLMPVNMPIHQSRIDTIKTERERLANGLASSHFVEKVWPSEANFLLLDTQNTAQLKSRLDQNGISVRDFGTQKAGRIRLSVGTPEQNNLVLNAFGVDVVAAEATHRTGQTTRTTNETSIAVFVDLDQAGGSQISSGIGFFDHMLEQLSSHGGFRLVLTASGDLEIDPHHTVEDCALALGATLDQALGTRNGIGRYGFTLPMDEAQAEAVIDLSGRPARRFEAVFHGDHIGEMPTELIEHFFESLSQALRAAIHIRADGDNDHHVAEAIFKSVGRALRPAIARTGQEVPSTKGVL